LKITDKTAARLIKHMEKHRGAWDAAKFPPSKKNVTGQIGGQRRGLVHVWLESASFGV
jgi:hypothetical protein